jgi:hypothetical protein
MRCLNDELLSSYIDQVLDPQEQKGVEDHLQECWHCRRVQGDYRTLSVKIHELPDLEVPKNFRQNLMSQLNAPKRRVFPLKYVGIAAAVLILAIAIPGFGLFNQPKEIQNSVQSVSVEDRQTASMQSAPMGGAAQPKAFDSATVGGSETTDKNLTKGLANVEGSSADAVKRGLAQRNINLELQVQNTDSASKAVYQQVVEIPGAGVISQNSLSSDKLKLELKIPGPQTQTFLAGLANVGTVLQGNFTGNIGEESGYNIVTILISKLQK